MLVFFHVRSSGLSLSGGDLICQPAFGLSSAETESLMSSVNCVQSVGSEHCSNVLEGSFDAPTSMDQQNLNDLADIMKLLEDQDSSSFTENGASQSDLNLSLEYLLNCKSTDVSATQTSGSFLPVSNVNIHPPAINQLSSQSAVVNQRSITSSQSHLQRLLSGNLRFLVHSV